MITEIEQGGELVGSCLSGCFSSAPYLGVEPLWAVGSMVVC